jgi:hypothetical protein
MKATVFLVLLVAACSHPPTAPTQGSGQVPAPPAPETGFPARPATQVKLDWDAFPKLPDTAKSPDGRAIYVASNAKGKADGTAPHPYKTIAAALAASRRGDRIQVKAGTYPEGDAGGFIGLEIPAGRGGVTLVSAGGRAIIKPAHVGITYGLDIGASDIVVRGFDVVGFEKAGIIIGNQGHTARNIVIADVSVTYEGEGAPDGIAMLPDNGGDDVVDGVLLHNVEVRGASIGVQCNTGPCRNLRFQGLRIHGAQVGTNSGYDGLAVENGDNILIMDAEVSGSSADGIDLKATRVAVFNAFVHHVGRNGIKLWKGGDIINSVVSHTGADASVSLGAGTYRIVHSVMAYHNWQGPSSYSVVVAYDDKGPSSIELVNSVFYRNSGGLYFGPDTQVRVSGCLFSEIGNGNLFEVTVPNAKRTTMILAQLPFLKSMRLGYSNLPPGTKPKFRDAAAADYRVGQGSPLIDAGVTDQGLPSFDLAFGKRTNGKRPDIGPFERQ